MLASKHWIYKVFIIQITYIKSTKWQPIHKQRKISATHSLGR